MKHYINSTFGQFGARKQCIECLWLLVSLLFFSFSSVSFIHKIHIKLFFSFNVYWKCPAALITQATHTKAFRCKWNGYIKNKNEKKKKQSDPMWKCHLSWMPNRIFYYYGILIIDFRVLRSPNETRVYHLLREKTNIILWLVASDTPNRLHIPISRYGIVWPNEARAHTMNMKKMHNVRENKTALCVRVYSFIRIKYTHPMRQSNPTEMIK